MINTFIVFAAIMVTIFIYCACDVASHADDAAEEEEKKRD